jgi:hypothetical protein
VRLDVYRSCTRAEKREVLEVFWRRNVIKPARITSAARQYGPWAIVCCVVLAFEPVPVLALSAGRNVAVVGIAALVEVVLLVSLWWATVRNVELRRLPLS